MDDELSMPDRILANAELVISTAAQRLGESVDYDEAGVEWLDRYIQRQHDAKNEAIWDGLTNTLGSFLGECIIRNFGGEWHEDDDGSWCVRFDDHNAVYPFNKTWKQLENGQDDSVLSFYATIPIIYRGILKKN